MKASKILIVEDNEIVANDILSRLKIIGYKNIEVAYNVREALLALQRFNPDLILMDIYLSDEIDGIELAAKINQENEVPIIYLTEASDHRTTEKVLNIRPELYLNKPVTEFVLQVNIEKVLNDNHGSSSLVQVPALFIPVTHGKIRVEYKNIMLIEAERAYCKIRTLDKDYRWAGSMAKLRRKIPKEQFIQVHRSYVVNIDHVISVQANTISLRAIKELVPIGRSYKKKVQEILNIL